MSGRRFEPVALNRALQEMEAVYRAVFDQHYQLAAVLDCDGVLVDVNQCALGLIGGVAEDYVGKPFAETPWWSHSPELQRRLNDAIASVAGGGVERFDAQHPRHDGSMASVRFSLRPVRDAAGEVAYLVAEAVDVSDLREVEARIIKERDEHQVLANAMPVAVAFIGVDGRYRFHNQHYLDQVGVGEATVVGRLASEVLGPAVFGRIAEPLGRALRGERAHFRGALGYDVRTIEAQVDYFPRLDDAGQCVGAYVVIRDCTEQVEADRETRRHASRLESLVGATQDAIVFIDGSARIVSVNDSALTMFGWRREELVGQKVEVLMPEPYRSEHDGYIARYEQTGEARAVGRIRRVEAVRASGEVFPIELSITKLSQDDEVRYAAFIRDVSVQAELQRHVVHAEKLAAIGTTTAKLAHEIGNPLNNLTIQATLLRRRLEALELADPTVDECVGSMREELGRLSRLLDEFRLLARKNRLTKASCDVGELVRRVASMAATLASNVDVEVAVDEDLPAASLDGDKITQVLLNLAKNAVEAMPSGGVLSFAATLREPRDITISVADTGPGIPEGLDVFEPFVTTKDTGTGLGLPVAQQIVMAHHGVLRHGRTAEGGTVFRLELPLEAT